MTDLNRREVVQLLSAVAWTSVFRLTPAEADRAARAVRQGGSRYVPEFFTDEEWETVRLLVDIIIPADEHSGSATDALVPEFMDFTMMDRPSRQQPMRGGLMWLDIASERRFGRRFVQCNDAQRTELLNDIAWPERAPDEAVQGVAFFNSFRDLTASGFYSSKLGVQDLQYTGNRGIAEWRGCPEDVLDHLGVSYDDEAP